MKTYEINYNNVKLYSGENTQILFIIKHDHGSTYKIYDYPSYKNYGNWSLSDIERMIGERCWTIIKNDPIDLICELVDAEH